MMVLWRVSLLLVVLPGLMGCQAIQSWWSDETPVIVTSALVTLKGPPPPAPVPPPLPPEPTPEPGPRITEITIIGDDEPEAAEPLAQDVLSNLTTSNSAPMPTGAFEAGDLTMRLKEKMAEAYGGDMNRVPDAHIFLSNEGLSDVIEFYEARGYKIQRVSVPIERILRPVLRDRPELADRIRLEDYEDQRIEQVMIEGTGISAADRYIDPDTYEVVERTFITEMPLH